MNKKKDLKHISNSERIQLILLCSFFLVGIALIIHIATPKDSFIRYPLIGILCVIYIILMSHLTWQCPDCRRRLTDYDIPERCPRCGAQLDNMRSRLIKYIDNIFKTDPTTKDFPPCAPPTRIIFDTGKQQLNDIGFHDPMSAFKLFGPADETDYDEGEGLLVYSKLGIAAEGDKDGVYSFEVVIDPTWEELSSKECTAFYLRTDSGKEVHLDYKTNENELTDILGEPNDRTSLSNGDLQCLYDVSGTFITATFKDNGKSLRHLEFVKSAGPADSLSPDEQQQDA
jgi:hypothetical protein